MNDLAELGDAGYPRFEVQQPACGNADEYQRNMVTCTLSRSAFVDRIVDSRGESLQLPSIHHPFVRGSPVTEVVDCGDARLSVRSDFRVTVLTITGEIYASNADDISRHVQGLVPPVGALIIDLSGVDFVAVAGLRVLRLFSIECARASIPWALVTNNSVTRLLRVGDPDGTLPAVASVAEALCLVRSAARTNRPLRLVTPTN